MNLAHAPAQLRIDLRANVDSAEYMHVTCLIFREYVCDAFAGRRMALDLEIQDPAVDRHVEDTSEHQEVRQDRDEYTGHANLCVPAA